MSLTRSSATAEITRDAWNGHSGSLKVIRCCANRRGILCDFVLTLNSKPPLSTVLEMSGLVCTSIPHLSSKWNWKKDGWGKWTCLGVRVPRTLDCPTINLNPDIMAVARRFVLTNASRAKNVPQSVYHDSL